MAAQNATLRITVNVDFNEPTEVNMLKAVLRRLNVLHVRSRPRSAWHKIMGDAKLRDVLDIGRQRQANKRNGVIQLPDRSKATNDCTDPKCNLRNYVHSHGKPSKKEGTLELKRYDPPTRLAFKYTSLKEVQYDPPTDLPDLEGGRL